MWVNGLPLMFIFQWLRLPIAHICVIPFFFTQNSPHYDNKSVNSYGRRRGVTAGSADVVHVFCFPLCISQCTADEQTKKKKKKGKKKVLSCVSLVHSQPLHASDFNWFDILWLSVDWNGMCWSLFVYVCVFFSLLLLLLSLGLFLLCFFSPSTRVHFGR